MIFVTGATGLVGGRLVRGLASDGVPVRAATRSPARARFDAGVEAIGWDGVRVAAADLAGARAIVHLAGEPIFGGLLTAARRERILASRVDSTRALVAAIGALPARERPAAFVCASAVGYYGTRGDEELDESAPPGRGFLAEVCVAWEEAARGAEAHGVRVVSLRLGVVLARDGGAFVPMRRAFSLGLGGRFGDGRQWFPWIGIDDAVALLRASIDDDRMRGAVNAVGPTPIRNADFTRALASALRRPALLTVPAFALRAALGELSGELLGSRRVVPARAIELGFGFAAPAAPDAIAAALAPD